MRKNLLFAMLVLCLSACSTATPAAPAQPTSAPPTQNVAPVSTEIPVVNTRTDRRAPTLAPTEPATAVPTASETPTPSATATLAATETSLPLSTPSKPAPTATLELAAGVYVTAFRVEPAQPKSKPAEFHFHLAFLNTVGEAVNYPRWRVLIFPKGQDKAIGDPQGESKTIANGASEQNTQAWSINVTSVCETFTARPIWEREDRVQVPLPAPDGNIPSIEFQVCP
jgi:hypothetical protein